MKTNKKFLYALSVLVAMSGANLMASDAGLSSDDVGEESTTTLPSQSETLLNELVDNKDLDSLLKVGKAQAQLVADLDKLIVKTLLAGQPDIVERLTTLRNLDVDFVEGVQGPLLAPLYKEAGFYDRDLKGAYNAQFSYNSYYDNCKTRIFEFLQGDQSMKFNFGEGYSAYDDNQKIKVIRDTVAGKFNDFVTMLIGETLDDLTKGESAS